MPVTKLTPREAELLQLVGLLTSYMSAAALRKVARLWPRHRLIARRFFSLTQRRSPASRDPRR
jgi:hypothetical protein